MYGPDGAGADEAVGLRRVIFGILQAAQPLCGEGEGDLQTLWMPCWSPRARTTGAAVVGGGE
jgi:hypothetical protein